MGALLWFAVGVVIGAGVVICWALVVAGKENKDAERDQSDS